MSRTSADTSAATTNRAQYPTKKSQELEGQLDEDGIVRLEQDINHIRTNRSEAPRSLKKALDEAAVHRRGSSDGSETDSVEDYDSLKVDPMSVVNRGGAYLVESGTTTPDTTIEKGFEEVKIPSEQRPDGMHKRRKSIPITLSKMNEKGKYMLTADDTALREILKSTVADYSRHKNPESPKRRTKFSDLVFTRQFTAFDRNSDLAESPFHGFYTLFWLAVGVFVVQLAAENWQKHGHILGTNEIMAMAFHRDVMVLGLSDGVMCAATGFGLVLQKLIHRGYLSWNREGWIIQSVWQLVYITAVLGWTLFREWPWTHTVFFVLHGIVMLMKQHSYAFYNGHLSSEYETRAQLLSQLKRLDDFSPVQTPSATNPAASSLSTTYLDHRPTSSDVNQRLYERRKSLADPSTTDKVAAAISAGEPLDLEQIQTFARILKWEIDVLSQELKGKSTLPGKNYPSNLTLSNHYEFIVLPTLVYELEYPRSERIDWYYVAEKAAGIVGVLGIMNLISQTFIYPVVVRTLEMKEIGMPLDQRLRIFPSIISDLAFPFLAEYILAWYVIWELTLNLLAELTFFADRGFYSSWWNSISWDQFARDWNRPVHAFLLRHVYHSSISTFRVNKTAATLITFGLSAVVHELVMWCLFKKLRGYLLVMQMAQLPLVRLSKMEWLRGRRTLGNVIFWVGIFTGPSLLCSLYLVI